MFFPINNKSRDLNPIIISYSENPNIRHIFYGKRSFDIYHDLFDIRKINVYNNKIYLLIDNIGLIFIIEFKTGKEFKLNIIWEA